MSSAATAILQDIVQALRQSDDLALVTLGDDAASNVVPRASVLCDGVDFFASDDSGSTRWGRLSGRILIHARSAEATQRTTRLNDLCEAVTSALLADPYRGGECCHLPIGYATEIGRSEPAPGVRNPEGEAIVIVRCHFETAGGG